MPPACPLRAALFDLVLSLDVLAHFQRGAEIDAAPRNDARAALPADCWWCERPRSTFCAAAIPSSLMSGSASPGVVCVERFEAAGFRVLRCTYANSLLMPVALAKFRLWEPLLRGPASTGVAPVAPWLDRLLYAPLAMESAWIGAGGKFSSRPVIAAGWRENGLTVELAQVFAR